MSSSRGESFGDAGDDYIFDVDEEEEEVAVKGAEGAPAPAAAAGSSRYLTDGQAAALAKAEAGLAPGWKPVWSKTQRDYYWSHVLTKETTWSKPTLPGSNNGGL